MSNLSSSGDVGNTTGGDSVPTEAPHQSGVIDGVEVPPVVEGWSDDDGELPDNIIQFPISAIECNQCQGRGFITGFTGRIKSEQVCPRCHGDGKLRIR